MIASDSSSLVALFSGDSGPDIDQLAQALSAGTLVLPPPVLTELLTDAASATLIEAGIRDIGLLEIREGYWERAGLARRTLHRHRLKAKVADALIAQACIDNDVALITRDGDFRHFAKHCGLKLA
jgi:predicted nucleic acid-binding protein